MRKLLILIALFFPAAAIAMTCPVVSFDTTNGMTCSTAAPIRSTSTVGALPTCNSGSLGKMYIVTDALIPVALATVVAGGAIAIGVTCNGTNWIVQ